MTPVQLFSALLAMLLFALIIELVRRERLTFKYAVGWLLVSVLGFIFSLNDGLLRTLARLLGFELLSNFVFFAILGVFVFLSLVLTILLCQQNERNDRLAQRLGLLEDEIEKLKKK